MTHEELYAAVIARFEPAIVLTDQEAALTSIAISLKRIADQGDETQRKLDLIIYQGSLDVRMRE